MQRKLLGIINVDSDARGRLLIRHILEKKWKYNEAVHQLFIDFKKAYDSVRREVLYNILIEFGIPKKLLRLIKMCLTETYSRVWVGKNLSDMSPIRNGLKSNGDRASPCFKPFLIGNMSDKFLPTRTLLYVSVRHIFITLTSFLGTPNSMRILYKTSLLTES